MFEPSLRNLSTTHNCCMVILSQQKSVLSKNFQSIDFCRQHPSCCLPRALTESCVHPRGTLGILWRFFLSGLGNHLTEKDEFATGTLYFPSAIHFTPINSSSLLCSKTCINFVSKQSSMRNVVNTNNKQYLETDPFSVLCTRC